MYWDDKNKVWNRARYADIVAEVRLSHEAELRKVLTKLAEEVRIAYVRWEKDQTYDGEKAEYDLVEDAVRELTSSTKQEKEG
jgi:hypothetical protein